MIWQAFRHTRSYICQNMCMRPITFDLIWCLWCWSHNRKRKCKPRVQMGLNILLWMCCTSTEPYAVWRESLQFCCVVFHHWGSTTEVLIRSIPNPEVLHWVTRQQETRAVNAQNRPNLFKEMRFSSLSPYPLHLFSFSWTYCCRILSRETVKWFPEHVPLICLLQRYNTCRFLSNTCQFSLFY